MEFGEWGMGVEVEVDEVGESKRGMGGRLGKIGQVCMSGKVGMRWLMGWEWK